jgi:hypothetical protein
MFFSLILRKRKVTDAVNDHANKGILKYKGNPKSVQKERLSGGPMINGRNIKISSVGLDPVEVRYLPRFEEMNIVNRKIGTKLYTIASNMSPSA